MGGRLDVFPGSSEFVRGQLETVVKNNGRSTSSVTTYIW